MFATEDDVHLRAHIQWSEKSLPENKLLVRREPTFSATCPMTLMRTCEWQYVSDFENQQLHLSACMNRADRSNYKTLLTGMYQPNC